MKHKGAALLAALVLAAMAVGCHSVNSGEPSSAAENLPEKQVEPVVDVETPDTDDEDALFQQETDARIARQFGADMADLHLDLNSTVLLQSERLTSVLYEGTANVEGAAHPTTVLFSVNLDREQGKKVTLADLVDINDAFVALVMENAAQTLDEAYGATVNTMTAEQWQARLLAADMEQSGDCAAFSPDKTLTIYLEVPHAAGDVLAVAALPWEQWSGFAKDPAYFA